MRRLPVATALLLLIACVPLAHAKDYAAPGSAYSILLPGQSGNVPTDENSTDQADMYDALTPQLGNVSAGDLADTFKPNVFGVRGQKPVRREQTPNEGVNIRVDRWGVPHITAKKRNDVFYGLGWMVAKERHLLLELARPLGRLAILDPPGINAFGLVTSLRQFTPSAEANAIVKRQVGVLRRAGKKGRRMLKDIKAYIRGLNAQYKDAERTHKPWNMVDFISVAGFIGSIFGRGGGDEARRSMFLDALRMELGEGRGTEVWNDLRNFQDPETRVSLTKSAGWGQIPQQNPGNAVIDDGSFEPVAYSGARPAAARPEPPTMSNALLASAGRSKNGHPLFVAGPQLGTYYPALVYEVDLHGGGIDARGITSTGAGPYVFIGRNQDFAWSLTSANNDIVDTFVETLCDGSDTKYMYKGECRDMTVVDAGLLKGNSETPDQRLRWHETEHGPVLGYATVDGTRVAISQARSTRGREVLSLRFFHDLNSAKIKTAKQFTRAANQLEHTFNTFFADEEDIAMFSSCRCPTRAPGVDPGLPTRGDGSREWRGFLSRQNHPQAINPRRGLILNWNNKPSKDWGAADDQWSYGAIHRVELFDEPISRRKEHTLASVVGVMNEAATQDLRAELGLFAPIEVLETGVAPSPRAAQMLELLKDWRAKNSSRIDSDLDGLVDHPGAAILDEWWPLLGDAVMSPVLGDLTDRLADVNSRGGPPPGNGNAFGGGWISYIDKDLRTLLGREVRGKYNEQYCGDGVLAACATALWASLEAAGDTLAAEQGADPAAWRKSTETERTKFAPGLIDKTIQFSNRPTFQQAITFRGGRKD
ncbi:MAG TPA: penicillin acylase family protein [Thermoleophilaceae bacterium]|nr:penicillin acylase family protein [Thermoleophilaceae bacterium]